MELEKAISAFMEILGDAMSVKVSVSQLSPDNMAAIRKARNRIELLKSKLFVRFLLEDGKLASADNVAMVEINRVG